MPNSNSKLGKVRNDGRWHSRGSDWATPQELYDSLNAEFHFTLDSCALAWNAKCENYYTVADDGLTQDWGFNTVWMNPPYGIALSSWMRKAYRSAQLGATVVCLVPAATDTAWWHAYAMRGEIKFLRGRPWFRTPSGERKQLFSPSVVVIFHPAEWDDAEANEELLSHLIDEFQQYERAHAK